MIETPKYDELNELHTNLFKSFGMMSHLLDQEFHPEVSREEMTRILSEMRKTAMSMISPMLDLMTEEIDASVSWYDCEEIEKIEAENRMLKMGSKDHMDHKGRDKAIEEAMKYIGKDECVVLWNDEWQQQEKDNMPTNFKRKTPERVEPTNGNMDAKEGHWIVMIDDEETWMSLPNASLVLLTTEQMANLESICGKWDGECVEQIFLTEELAREALTVQ
tara:strand:+ start:797 stop:1453 length:657 start_codon:yes stop_codon:yes gene_type:complete